MSSRVHSSGRTVRPCSSRAVAKDWTLIDRGLASVFSPLCQLSDLARRGDGPAGEVLDRGCGNGHFSCQLLRPGHRVTGFRAIDARVPDMKPVRGPRAGHPYLAGAPLLIAHRGGAGLAPENTRVAFERAVRWWRADILELDVQPTRDGEAVVFHDSTLDRTTDGEGPIASRSLGELRELDAGHHFLDPDGGGHTFRGTGVGISSFREILEAFPTTRINVEIKDARAQESVHASIEEAGAWHRVLVAAGRRANRARFANYPGPVSASGEELRAFYAAFRLRALRLVRLPYDALQIPERYGGVQVLTPRLVKAAHARNLPVHVWTVDDTADMRRLLQWGVDGIVTDRPDRLAVLLHEMHERPLPPGPAPSGR